MTTKDLQTLNLKFEQVMFNSLVFTCERNFEVTFGIFSVLVSQINVLESYLLRYLPVLKLVMIKNVKIVIIKAFKSKFYQYFIFTKKVIQRFVSFCISLIFTYCLFVEKKLVTTAIFLSSHLKPYKWVIYYYFQDISRNCHFVTHFDPPKKLRRKILIVNNFFITNKQYVKITD